MTFFEPIQQIKMSFWSRSDMFPMFLFPLPEKKKHDSLEKLPHADPREWHSSRKIERLSCDPKKHPGRGVDDFCLGGKRIHQQKNGHKSLISIW